MWTRRAVTAGLALAPLAARATSPMHPLDQAISAMGGEAALRAAPVLRWTGAATVYAGAQTIEIGTQTVVEPFRYARSRTWLKDRPSEVRELLIDGEEAYLIGNGVGEPMPEPMRVHEAAQYSLYGLMRLLPLKDWPQDVRWRAGEGGMIAEVRHGGLPETELLLDPAYRLRGARNRVPGEKGGALVAQDIVFSETITGGGLRWPKVIEIRRSGLPYFRLTLTTFQPGRTRELPVSKA